MAEVAKHGGKRPGAGRPTAAAQRAKQAAAKAAGSAREVKTAKALAAAQQHVQDAALKGERWAIEMLMAYEVGKPGTKVTTIPDTEINLIVRFPRGAVACPHCGREITHFLSQEVLNADDTTSDLLRLGDGGVRPEEARTVGEGAGPPAGDDGST